MNLSGAGDPGGPERVAAGPRDAEAPLYLSTAYRRADFSGSVNGLWHGLCIYLRKFKGRGLSVSCRWAAGFSQLDLSVPIQETPMYFLLAVSITLLISIWLLFREETRNTDNSETKPKV